MCSKSEQFVASPTTIGIMTSKVPQGGDAWYVLCSMLEHGPGTSHHIGADERARGRSVSPMEGPDRLRRSNRVSPDPSD
jgi:hypothetical protein